jgi:bifunctional DNase/RNase
MTMAAKVTTARVMNARVTTEKVMTPKVMIMTSPIKKSFARWWILLLAAALAACADGGRAPAESDEVRVRVAKVGVERDGTAYVMLEESGGRRSLPILIGNDEARAILFELDGQKPQRPLTYELLREVIVRTGNHVDRVTIAEMHDGVYFARISLDSGRYSIDSRPSDAIALAMSVDAPIFVASNLMEVSSPAEPATPIHTARRLGLHVQEITPDLAQYFGVEPMDGVLVAEAGRAAAGAGVDQGDIITQVEGRDVHTPEEFARQVSAAAAANQNVALTLLRKGKARVVTIPASGNAAQP